MELRRLLEGIEVEGEGVVADVEVNGVEIDSRLVKKGNLFVAMMGTQTDGHKFIGAAVERGAVAVVCEEVPQGEFNGVCFVKVKSTMDTVGAIATAFYGNPTERLRLVGVTGTNGKTTTATLLYELFTELGYKCGLISTVRNLIAGEELPAHQTTPDPISLNRLLGRMADAGCSYAFMECSSHAIEQRRIGGLRFAGGIFTNLTRDHLDYHKTFENYRDAKKLFFDTLPSDAFALTNVDDKNGMFMVQNTKARVKTYSRQRLCDFHAKILEMDFDGMLLDFDGRQVSVSLVGKFNVSNLLAIYGGAVLLGVAPDEALRSLSGLRAVAGRFETLRSPRGYTAIVDYAHTPDAIENVLGAINEVLRHNPGISGRVITVCGAGGNRDKGKRPQMAREALRQSDIVILTSDNPRFEEPESIIDDMRAGVGKEDEARVICITDRREAITAACTMAKAGDVVLVAGKGHEDYQEMRGVKHHFDDKEELQKIFARR